MQAGSAGIYDLTLVGDNLTTWQWKMKEFDLDCPGGRQLDADLQRLARERKHDHLLMECSFPKDYPTQPFAVRLVLPRCVWYTGHVTAGGRCPPFARRPLDPLHEPSP